jgi:4-hydroxybenzoate polyprenyltransferase
MAAWLTYIKERFPIPVYLLLAGGVTTTGLLAKSGPMSWPALALGVVGLLLFLGLLRLMDEYKDYDKDRVAHPERPLPRGLLKIETVRKVIHAGVLLMLAYVGVAYLYAGLPAALLYLVSTAFLWLMFKEFYVGTWLSKIPILYAVTHQVVMLPLVAFCTTLARPEMWNDPHTWYAASAALGSFFTYEICRKLDPDAPRILDTYLIHHGRIATTFFLICTCALAAWGAHQVGLQLVLWPAGALVLASVSIIYFAPRKHKVVEAIATLSLVAHLWAHTIRHYAGWPS